MDSPKLMIDAFSLPDESNQNVTTKANIDQIELSADMVGAGRPNTPSNLRVSTPQQAPKELQPRKSSRQQRKSTRCEPTVDGRAGLR